MPRHYRLTPVRLNPDGQWLQCNPALLERYAIEYQEFDERGLVPEGRRCWFADVSPKERLLAERVVAFLNRRE